jgi:hypothetical protein
MLFAFLSLTLDALTVQNTPWLLSPSCWMCSVIIWVVGMILAVNSRQHLTTAPLEPLVRSLHHTCLVGTFHGYAHRRLCQLFSLTTYIKGLRIEDLETCECTFSKSNSLASVLCYASVFHRQQAIDSYFEHNDDFKVQCLKK